MQIHKTLNRISFSDDFQEINREIKTLFPDSENPACIPAETIICAWLQAYEKQWQECDALSLLRLEGRIRKFCPKWETEEVYATIGKLCCRCLGINPTSLSEVAEPKNGSLTVKACYFHFRKNRDKVKELFNLFPEKQHSLRLFQAFLPFITYDSSTYEYAKTQLIKIINLLPPEKRESFALEICPLIAKSKPYQLRIFLHALERFISPEHFCDKELINGLVRCFANEEVSQVEYFFDQQEENAHIPELVKKTAPFLTNKHIQATRLMRYVDAFCQKDCDEVAEALNGLGNVHWDYFELSQIISYFQKTSKKERTDLVTWTSQWIQGRRRFESYKILKRMINIPHSKRLDVFKRVAAVFNEEMSGVEVTMLIDLAYQQNDNQWKRSLKERKLFADKVIGASTLSAIAQIPEEHQETIGANLRYLFDDSYYADPLKKVVDILLLLPEKDQNNFFNAKIIFKLITKTDPNFDIVDCLKKVEPPIRVATLKTLEDFSAKQMPNALKLTIISQYLQRKEWNLLRQVNQFWNGLEGYKEFDNPWFQNFLLLLLDFPKEQRGKLLALLHTLPKFRKTPTRLQDLYRTLKHIHSKNCQHNEPLVEAVFEFFSKVDNNEYQPYQMTRIVLNRSENEWLEQLKIHID